VRRRDRRRGGTNQMCKREVRAVSGGVLQRRRGVTAVARRPKPGSGVDEGGRQQVRRWSRVGRTGAAASASCSRGTRIRARPSPPNGNWGGTTATDWEGGTGRPSADWGRQDAVDR
jgi:hypothetical protein